MKSFYRSIYFSARIYYVIATVLLLLILSFFFSSYFWIAQSALAIFIALLLTDILILYKNKDGFSAKRNTLDKLSNGDVNSIQLLCRIIIYSKEY